MHIRFLIPCFFFYITFVFAQPQYVNIGVIVSRSGAFGALGQHTLNVMDMWDSFYNTKTRGILGTDIYPNFIICDCKSLLPLALECARNLTTLPNHIDVAFLPESTMMTEAMKIMEEKQIISFSFRNALKGAYICDSNLLSPCKHSGSRRFQWLIGSIPLAGDTYQEAINILANKGAKRMTVVKYQDAYNQEVCNAAIEYASNIRITMDGIYDIPTVYDQSHLDNIMTQLKSNENIDILAICNRAKCIETVKWIAENKLNSKETILVQCVDYPNSIQTLGDQIRYVLGPSTWDSRLRGTFYRDDPQRPYANHFISNFTANKESPQIFYEAFQQRYGYYPDSLAAATMNLLYLLETGIYLSNSTKSADIYSEVSRVQMYTFYGRTMVNQMGLVQGDSVTYQVNHLHSLEIISPLSSSTMDIIYPQPKWNERQYQFHQFSNTDELSVVIVCTICSVLLLVLLLSIFWFRNHPRIKAISWFHSCINIIGSIMGCLWVLTWTVDNTMNQCYARIVLGIMAYTFTICPIIAKTYRINTIFNQTELKVVRMSDTKISGFTFLIAMPFYIVGILWISIYPPTLQYISLDSIRPNHDMHTCSFSGQGFWIAIIVFSVLSAIAQVFLVYRTRNVTDSFNEAVRISALLYTIFFTLVAMVGIHSATISPSTLFIIRSYFIMSCMVLCMFILYAGKVWSAMSVEETEMLSDMNATMMNSNNNKNSGMKQNKSSLQQKRNNYMCSQPHHKVVVVESPTLNCPDP